jgi:hypothetical protein
MAIERVAERHSRLAAQQEQMAMTPGHVAQTCAQLSQLAIATDKRARWRVAFLTARRCHRSPGAKPGV